MPRPRTPLSLAEAKAIIKKAIAELTEKGASEELIEEALVEVVEEETGRSLQPSEPPDDFDY